MISGKNYIGFELKASGDSKFRTFNPQQNVETKWEFIEATAAEIVEACNKAAIAFKAFRSMSSKARAEFLMEIANEMEKLDKDLFEVYCSESGLDKQRAKAEFSRTVFQLRSFAQMLLGGDWKMISVDVADLNRQPNPKPDLRKTYIPLGPVAVFGASNFPLAYSTAGGDTASALAAGCPVVVKSHPMHAATGELVASAIVRAANATGMPDGVFSNLNSKGVEVGVQLVNNPNIKAVGFTGSIKGGRALFDIANARPEPIPVFAEMGSINPVVISEGCLKDEAEEWSSRYAESITNGTGQFCTNPGLILALDSSSLDGFIELLSKKVEEKEASCMLHPEIKRSFSELKQTILNQEGVEQFTESVNSVKDNYADQTVVKVKGETFLRNNTLHNEVFGPFSMVVSCEDTHQMVEIIEKLEGQLTGTIIAQDNELSEMVAVVSALQYRVGRLIFNGVPTGVEVCPSMNHGGPYPASTDSRFTAVGIHSVQRWIRPVTFQNFPFDLLPTELR